MTLPGAFVGMLLGGASPAGSSRPAGGPGGPAAGSGHRRPGDGRFVARILQRPVNEPFCRRFGARGRGASSTAQTTLPPSAAGITPNERERPVTTVSPRPRRCGDSIFPTGQAWAMVPNGQAQRPQVPGDGQVDVGAGVHRRAGHELADHQVAKGMVRPSRQSSRVRVTNSRDARGAVGWGASFCSHSTTRGAGRQYGGYRREQ